MSLEVNLMSGNTNLYDRDEPVSQKKEQSWFSKLMFSKSPSSENSLKVKCTGQGNSDYTPPVVDVRKMGKVEDVRECSGLKERLIG